MNDERTILVLMPDDYGPIRKQKEASVFRFSEWCHRFTDAYPTVSGGDIFKLLSMQWAQRVVRASYLDVVAPTRPEAWQERLFATLKEMLDTPPGAGGEEA